MNALVGQTVLFGQRCQLLWTHKLLSKTNVRRNYLLNALIFRHFARTTRADLIYKRYLKLTILIYLTY